MKRTYIRVTPGEEPVISDDIPETVASLSKLPRSDDDLLRRRLNPLHSRPPIRFEFVALCAGENEPVEFYYGADDQLDAFEQRLESIYPASYEMARVEIDLVKRLVRPVEFTREEFAERLATGRLYHEMPQPADASAAVSVGGGVSIDFGSVGGWSEPPEVVDPSEQADAILEDVDLAGPQAGDGTPPPTALDRPTENFEGTILARPPLAEVEPYGVEWWGAAARRKDWMTTLTGFTELLGLDQRTAEGVPTQSRLPLQPLLTALATAEHPLAFQVVFQPRADWSSDATRRTGELLGGTDTLLQTFFSLESPGSQRRTSRRRDAQGTIQRRSYASSWRRTRSVNGGWPSRPSNVEAASRYDQVRANTPKRTFSVNLQLLALAVDGDDPADLAVTLDSLRSVFDLVDGEFYEMDGRRLRSKGVLPGSGERHARAVLDRFTSRSVVTSGRRVGITNRGETRPDLVLNGNELANYLIIPTAQDIPAPVSREEGATQSDSDDRSGTATTGLSLPSREGLADESGGDPFSTSPKAILHRDDQINQLSEVFEPIAQGARSDDVLVTGPTGSGKTCTTTFTIDRIRQEHPAFDAIYINCWEDHSRFQVLYQILNEIDSTVDIHRQATPRDILLDRLREYDQGPCLVVLDDVDQLEDKHLLYELLNMTPFSLLLIVTQEEELLDGLDERLVSRLRGCKRVRFERYSDEQLVDILSELEERALDTGGFEHPELELIAEAADGDARVACTTLRLVARRCDGSGEEGISKKIVEGTLPDARQELIEKHVEGLTKHHHVLLEIIVDEGRITPGELYEQYATAIDDPMSERTVRDYLTDLEQDNLIAAEGLTRNRVYRSRLQRQP